MTDFNSFIISFLSSLLSSSIIIFVIFKFFKPNVKIGDSISKEIIEGVTEYRFKFYNNSFFGAVNVTASLVYGTPTEEGDENINLQYEEINLTKKESFYIPPFIKTNKKTKTAPHCITIGIQDPVKLEELINKYGHILVFRLNLTHQLTNISATIEKTYNRKDVIKDGKFEFGNTFNIVKI
jgi:hypothetical protein